MVTKITTRTTGDLDCVMLDAQGYHDVMMILSLLEDFFLMDEANTVGENGKSSHGPDAVITMVEHFVSKTFNGEKKLVMYCDNCGTLIKFSFISKDEVCSNLFLSLGGQNENKYVMGYGAHLINTDRYKEVEIHFLPVGHTKFSPDGFFGLFERIFRRSNLDLPIELVSHVGNSVKKSTTLLKGVAETDWDWKNWKSFLEPRYSDVKGIQGSYHFRLSKTANKGVVLEHSALDGINEEEVVLEYRFKRSTPAAQEKRLAKAQLHLTQEVVPVSGLSLARANQIIDTITQHVSFGKRQEFIDYIKQNCNNDMEEADADMEDANQDE